jgi:hypothetical protein
MTAIQGPMAGHHDADLGRVIVYVQTQRDRVAEYRDRWLRELRRSAAPRCGRTAPLAYVARPANRRASPCRLSIAYLRGSAIHACTAQRRDPARNDQLARVQLAWSVPRSEIRRYLGGDGVGSFWRPDDPLSVAQLLTYLVKLLRERPLDVAPIVRAVEEAGWLTTT